MTVRKRLRCRITVVLEAPFLMRGLEGLGFGVDAAQIRDREGRALIPGDQIKGLLRQAVRDLQGTAVALDEVEFFGRDIGEAEGQAGEQRGSLILSDLVAECPPTGRVLPRVAIDATTGSARSGHLLMAESVAPVGERVTFTGELVAFVADSPGKADEMITGLRAALKLIPAIGAMKTAGFGRVVEADIVRTAEEKLVPETPPQRVGGRLAWSFGIDRPLLVSAERLEANVLSGSEVIPGAVLKGALARRLEFAGMDPRSSPWLEILARLHVGHAFPRRGGKEHGRALPLSVVTNREQTTWCDALLWDDTLFPDGTIPLFRPDWKGDAERRLRERLGIGAGLPQLTRTRTAIDPELGRAEDARLFSFRMTDPTDVRWRAVLDTGDLAGNELQDLLAILADGLDGIGKTDASMTEVALRPMADPDPPLPVPDAADLFAIMLETPALMIDTEALEDADTLRQAFEQYFSEASGGRLACRRFFASESWAGGIVALGRTPYRPFVLVDAGSCFLLAGDPAPLRDWLRRGLPLPQWAIVEGLDWRTCRYLPENGFGAIGIDRARPVREGM